MKASKFKGSNVVYAEKQPQYNPLPALVFKDDETGKVITCWKLSFWERIRVLFFGKIWHSQLTFGANLQPINKSTRRSDFFTFKNQSKIISRFRNFINLKIVTKK